VHDTEDMSGDASAKVFFSACRVHDQAAQGTKLSLKEISRLNLVMQVANQVLESFDKLLDVLHILLGQSLSSWRQLGELLDYFCRKVTLLFFRKLITRVVAFDRGVEVLDKDVVDAQFRSVDSVIEVYYVF
jgi:hypothetical protein